jgi:hypothetical protein
MKWKEVVIQEIVKMWILLQKLMFERGTKKMN